MMTIFAILLACTLNAQTVSLTGEWRRSSDDRAEYSQVEFDDSQWETVRLPWTVTPPVGVYWLRRSIDLPADTPLQLVVGPVAEMYQVYINGVRIAEVGTIGDRGADFKNMQLARSRSFPIPRHVIAGRVQCVFSIRLYRYVATPSRLIYRGGTYQITPTPEPLTDENSHLYAEQRVRQLPNLMTSSVLLTLGVFFWLVWLADRRRRELWWLGLLVAARGLLHFSFYAELSLDSYPLRFPAWTGLVHAIFGMAMAEVVLAFAGLRSPWLRGIFWMLWVFHYVHATTVVVGSGIPWVISDLGLLFIILREALGGRGGDQGWGRTVWLVLASIAVFHLNTTSQFQRLPLPRTGVFAGGYEWNLTSIAVGGLSVILAGASLRRLIGDRREKERLTGELEAARTIQQLLLPSDGPESNSYQWSAVYEPALELGGDFHWNRMTPDGSLLVVLGDVSGKGLKAAMLVSMAVGVLRRETSLEPSAILTGLNDALTGYTDGGFVTCFCIRLRPDGRADLANAGHLAPWLDGQEVILEPGLPLGLASGAVYTQTELRIQAGQQLTCVSDGVIEAANGHGELFGFERTRQISGKSAQEIAEAARAWGQNDDITVVTVERRPG